MEAGFLLYVLSSACISWYIFNTLFTIFRPIKSTLYSVFYCLDQQKHPPAFICMSSLLILVDRVTDSWLNCLSYPWSLSSVQWKRQSPNMYKSVNWCVQTNTDSMNSRNKERVESPTSGKPIRMRDIAIKCFDWESKTMPVVKQTSVGKACSRSNAVNQNLHPFKS